MLRSCFDHPGPIRHWHRAVEAAVHSTPVISRNVLTSDVSWELLGHFSKKVPQCSGAQLPLTFTDNSFIIYYPIQQLYESILDLDDVTIDFI